MRLADWKRAIPAVAADLGGDALAKIGQRERLVFGVQEGSAVGMGMSVDPARRDA